jgi:hypothetical protein
LDTYIKQISVELLFNYRLVNESFEECVAFQRALKEFVASADPTYSKQHEEFFVGFDGRFVHSSIISGKSNMIVWESFFMKIYKFYNPHSLDILSCLIRLTSPCSYSLMLHAEQRSSKY